MKPLKCIAVLSAALGAFSSTAWGQASSVGQWSAVGNWPMPAVHSSLLPNGKVLFNGEYRNGDFPHLWDPGTDQVTALPTLGYNPFCGGHSLMSDGRVLVVGGHIDNRLGLPYASIFDFRSNTWIHAANMAQGRWYPTVMALPNGDMLVAGGSDQTGTHVAVPEVFSPSTGAWRRLTGASQLMTYYPSIYVLPDGRIFHAGRETSTHFLDVSGTGHIVSGPPEIFSGGSRQYATAAQYDLGKIIMIGGSDPPISAVEVIDFSQPSAVWRSVQPMSIARRNANSVSLPDGRVLVVGGSSGPGLDDSTHPALVSEVFNPQTEKWTQWANQPVYRGYHHTAFLLPDGRVLSAGSTGVNTYMTFSPPYLFAGSRPVITSAPTEIQYNLPFDIDTPQAAAISKVSLIRLAAVTHALDTNARYQRLSFTQTATGLEINAPPNGNYAPPGYYMLFILDGAGIPSVAKVVHVSGTGGPPPPPFDAGVPPVDAGSPADDAGSPIVDAGSPPPEDAGTLPPGTIFSDEFARVQSINLGNGWVTALGRWRVNQIAISDQSVPDLALAPVVCGDCTVESRLVGFKVPVTALTLRTQSGPSYDRYEAAVLSTGALQVRRVRGGTVTVLGTAASGIPDLTNWATVSATISGSGPVSISVRVNGVERLALTDTSGQAIGTSGAPGLYTERSGVAYDSFKVFSGTSTPLPSDAGTPPIEGQFSDNFNRANAATMGGNWTVKQGAWLLHNQEGQSDRSGGNLALENVARCQECTVEGKLISFGVPYAGVFLRASDDGLTRYEAVLNNAGKVQIRLVQNGVVTVLGEAPHGANVNNWNTLSLDANGTTLSVRVNNVRLVTVTDTTLTGAGWAGMAASTAGVPFEDFVLR